jgi:hypothetical protein
MNLKTLIIAAETLGSIALVPLVAPAHADPLPSITITPEDQQRWSQIPPANWWVVVVTRDGLATCGNPTADAPRNPAEVAEQMALLGGGNPLTLIHDLGDRVIVSPPERMIDAKNALEEKQLAAAFVTLTFYRTEKACNTQLTLYAQAKAQAAKAAEAAKKLDPYR